MVHCHVCLRLFCFKIQKMRVGIFVQVFLLFTLNAQCTSDEFCSIDEKKNCDGSVTSVKHYTDLDDKYQHIYNEIKKAEDFYVPCERKKCGCYIDVIARDLKPFEINSINQEMIEASIPRGTLYQVINGELYRDKECMFPSRCAGIEHFILKVLSNLSDTEFIVNTRDYPQSSVHFGGPLPIFSFSKTPEYFDIMYPAWSFWEGGPAISLYPKGLGRWDQHRESLNEASDKYLWEIKESKGFFVGSRTSSERDNLVLLSRRKPDLVDARYTKNQAWKSDADTLHAPPAAEVSLEDHCKYKYLFNYRGVAASFRHKHLFLCRSLVFHVGDEWTEFYYYAMKAWIHYIPIPKDASQQQLEHLLNFAKDNDHISKKIAIRGRDFIWEKLRIPDITCYWRRLLQRYSKLLTYKPALRSDLKHIKKR